MDNESNSFIEPADGEKRWYDLFSRGARDWLRHNDKVSEAVREKLPELIADVDMLGPKSSSSTVRVPVRFLEHYRFRLRDDEQPRGVGQGKGKPGDELVPPSQEGDPSRGEGGDNEGGYQFVLELKVDDIVDWLWEELKLPNLKRKEGRLEDRDYMREGWNKKGVRSRLDRRRSVKEAVKRRAHAGGPAFTDEDLRYRQLVIRKQPTTEAVVFFAMDVSSSMREADRQLAKTFFFWVVQGLRRQYTRIEPVFIAHTVDAWEFGENEFFQVTGSGGTVASTAFGKVLDVIEQRFDPSRFNIYLFYASDGANFSDDADSARTALLELSELSSFLGYVETQASSHAAHRSEMGRIVNNLRLQGAPIGAFPLRDSESVWRAIRAFFAEQAEEADS